MRVTILLCMIATTQIQAQGPQEPDLFRIGPGVIPPRVAYKVEPEYSPEARADRVQGTVIFQVVVDETGRATRIRALSPLGYGLDEKAQEAIEKWRFVPGTKDGRPVNILATIEVTFRFPGIQFNEKLEKQRTSFNVAMNNLTNSDSVLKDKAVKSMQDLARQKFPAAMLVVGLWETAGENMPKDSLAGWSLVRKAADENYGPALYQIGLRAVAGNDPNMTAEKGWKMLRDAATLGSTQAQFYLGQAYKKGDGVPLELDRSRRYFRICAARGQALCQYELARLLLDDPSRSPDDSIQAVAWAELAADQGVEQAREFADRERSRLTPSEITLVNNFKTRLVHK